MGSLHDVIRSLRAERSWSQAKLAEEAGLSRQTVIELEKENGTYGHNSGTLSKVARALGLDDAQALYLKASEVRIDA